MLPYIFECSLVNLLMEKIKLKMKKKKMRQRSKERRETLDAYKKPLYFNYIVSHLIF